MTGTSPFDVLPSDRGEDAVWSDRILHDLPYAGAVLTNPIHKGHAWRASVGLRSTRLLLCGGPKSPSSTLDTTDRPAWDSAGDMEWPCTVATYTPTALAKEAHASVWGQDIGPDGKVLHDPEQPVSIVEVRHLDPPSKVSAVARDVYGRLWLRDTATNSDLSFPGLAPFPLPFRACMVEPTADGLLVLDENHGLWEIDNLYCSAIRRPLPPLSSGERVARITATGGAGIILLTTDGALWWGKDSEAKHFKDRQCAAGSDCTSDAGSRYAYSYTRARSSSPIKEGLQALRGVRRRSRGTDSSRPTSPTSRRSSMSPRPSMSLSASARPSMAAVLFPSTPGRCTHALEVLTEQTETPGWHRLKNIPGTGRGPVLDKVVDVAKTGIARDRQVIVAVTSIGEVWARMADSAGRAAHDEGSATKEAGWEYLEHMSATTMTHVAVAPPPHASTFRTPYVSIASYGALDVKPGESPLRVVCLGPSDIDKLGLSRGVGARIVPDPLPPWLADTGVANVALGRTHTAVLTHAGEVYAWGNNENGQCGLGHAGGKVRSPTKIQMAHDQTGTLPLAVSVSVSDWGTCAVAFPPVPFWLSGNAGPDGGSEPEIDETAPPSKRNRLRASLRRSLSSTKQRWSISDHHPKHAITA